MKLMESNGNVTNQHNPKKTKYLMLPLIFFSIYSILLELSCFHY